MVEMNQHNSRVHRVYFSSFAAALCAVCMVRVTCAAEPLMSEKDIDEQSIVNALTPERPNGMTTRGLMYRPNGIANAPSSPAEKPAVGLLITFATNSSTLTTQAREALDKVANALQSERVLKFEVQHPASYKVLPWKSDINNSSLKSG